VNAVIYVTKGGNTAKLAASIAGAIGAAAQPVSDKPVIKDIDTLFVGASIYAGKIDGSLRDFLQTLTSPQVKKVIVFGSACGPKSAQSEIKSLLEPKGIAVSDDFFQCRGKFLVINNGRPNADDIKAASDFARKMVGA